MKKRLVVMRRWGVWALASALWACSNQTPPPQAVTGRASAQLAAKAAPVPAPKPTHLAAVAPKPQPLVTPPSGTPVAVLPTALTTPTAPAAKTTATPIAAVSAPTPALATKSRAVSGFAHAALPSGWHVLRGRVTRTLYDSFSLHMGDQLLADQLAAHFKRIFLFKLDTRSDLHPGDEFALVYEKTSESTDGLRILAASYTGRTTGTHTEGYFFKAPGAKQGHHYDPQGTEMQARLVASPVAEFEQVTSLLNDRLPRHEGIDFKADIGTPITLPYDATVLETCPRGKRGNGRYLKVRYDANGLEALFLHMDSLAPGLAEGRHLKAGTALGVVGNTGHSFAPHLHYQVQRDKHKPLDPYKIQGSTYKRLPASAMPAFQDELARLRRAMEQAPLQQAPVPEAASIRR